jgi:hypothetical protein
MARLQASCGQGIFKGERTSNKETDMTRSPHVEEILSTLDVFSILVDAILGEICADVKIR